jgi:hypothetical protein
MHLPQDVSIVIPLVGGRALTASSPCAHPDRNHMRSLWPMAQRALSFAALPTAFISLPCLCRCCPHARPPAHIQIAKHTVELAELVVEAEVFPAVLVSLKDPDEYVSKNVATLVREVCKHSPELATMVVNCGGAAAIVDFVSNSRGTSRMPGIMALGYVSHLSCHQPL